MSQHAEGGAVVNLSFRNLSFLLCMTALAACGDSRQAPAEEAVTAHAAYAALASDLSACGETFADCVPGDEPADRDACLMELSVCREDAITTHSSAADQQVDACAADSQSCFTEARDAAAAEGCRAGLHACLGVEATSMAGAGSGRPAQPDPEPAADAGMGRAIATGIGLCVETLSDCIEGDEPPRACANAALECVMGAVPVPDQARDAMLDIPDMPAMPDTPASDASMPAMPDTPAADASMPAMPDTPAGDEPADPAADCAAVFEACVAAGEAPAQCAKALRACTMQ